jgi:hypothetical protein
LTLTVEPPCCGPENLGRNRTSAPAPLGRQNVDVWNLRLGRDQRPSLYRLSFIADRVSFFDHLRMNDMTKRASLFAAA